jgi:hypothetical protein
VLGETNATSVDVDPDLQFTSHLHSTSVGAPASSLLNANITSMVVSGSDTAFELTITVAAGGLAANVKAGTLTFAAAYTGAALPKVYLIDQTSQAGLAIVNSYVMAGQTNAAFDLAFDQALVAGVYKIDVLVIGRV